MFFRACLIIFTFCQKKIDLFLVEVGLTPPDRKHVFKFFLRPTFECDPYGSCEMFEGIIHATILRARIRCI